MFGALKFEVICDVVGCRSKTHVVAVRDPENIDQAPGSDMVRICLMIADLAGQGWAAEPGPASLATFCPGHRDPGTRGIPEPQPRASENA